MQNKDDEWVEQSIEKAIRFLSRSFEHSPLPKILVAIPDAKIRFANAAMSAFLGMEDRPSIIGMSLFDFVPTFADFKSDGTFGLVQELLPSRAFRGENTVNEEHRIVRQDGTVRWALVSAAPIHDDNGSIIAAFLNILDATEQKAAKEAQQEREEQLRKLSDNIPGGLVYQIDSGVDGSIRKFTYLSAGVESLHEISTEEVLADPMRMYAQVIPEDLEKVAKLEAEAFGSLSAFSAEVRVRLPSGKSRWRLFQSAPRCLANQHVVWDGIEVDITERKAFEEALEVEKEKVREAHQRTARLDALGLLAGGIAHDFNNLLGGIFGYIDLALMDSDETIVKSHLARAMNALARARGLTRQLLTFSKGGAPHKKVEHLFPFVEDTVKFALSGTAISCRFSIADDLFLCDIDRNQIEQVIGNIVINAREAMPNGGTVDVSARNVTFGEGEHTQLDEGSFVCLSIQDFGVGIPKDYQSRIFDPFYTTKTKGHGLGLSTGYSIVRKHGGTIDVESEPGKGSVFHVYLPESFNDIVQKEAESPARHIGEGVFVVMDDEEVILETLGAMLKSFGYSVLCGRSGEEALQIFRRESDAGRKIAGMIFDLTVPGGMGGLETVGEVRKISTDIPVFVSSGYADDPVMAAPRSFGFTGSVPKPFRTSDLTTLLNKWLIPRA